MGYSVIQVETGKVVYENLEDVALLNDIVGNISKFAKDFPKMDSEIIVTNGAMPVYSGLVSAWEPLT